MPRKTKDAPGRVTPKGGPSGPRSGRQGPAKRVAASGGGAPSGSTSGRYTAPIPSAYRSSPRWVPYLILTLFVAGLLMIVLNYLPGVMPGRTSNGYLFGGLGLIVAGFIASTRWH